MKNSEPTEQSRGQGAVLDVQPEWTYADCTVALSPGDRLLFFTDGVSEAEDEKPEESGHAGIADVAGISSGSAVDLKS